MLNVETKNLSLKAHKKGYTPRHRIIDGKVEPWADKDQTLNTKGFHHFHLDITVQHTGISARTEELLFAKVTRKEFHAVAIFDHSVFEPADVNGNLEPERKRMWNIHEKFTTKSMAPGSVYVVDSLVFSGHPVGVREMTDHYIHTIMQYDAKLSDRALVNQLYQSGNLPPPKRHKFECKLTHWT